MDYLSTEDLVAFQKILVPYKQKIDMLNNEVKRFRSKFLVIGCECKDCGKTEWVFEENSRFCWHCGKTHGLNS